MSRENVEIVRRLHEALNSGDDPLILELLDPEIVWVQNPDAPDPRTFYGHEGVRELAEMVADAFDEVQRAEQDEDRFQEEARQYANTLLGNSRGQAAQIREDAAAYKNRVVQEAEGEAGDEDGGLVEGKRRLIERRRQAGMPREQRAHHGRVAGFDGVAQLCGGIGGHGVIDESPGAGPSASRRKPRGPQPDLPPQGGSHEVPSLDSVASALRRKWPTAL